MLKVGSPTCTCRPRGHASLVLRASARYMCCKSGDKTHFDSDFYGFPPVVLRSVLFAAVRTSPSCDDALPLSLQMPLIAVRLVACRCLHEQPWGIARCSLAPSLLPSATSSLSGGTTVCRQLGGGICYQAKQNACVFGTNTHVLLVHSLTFSSIPFAGKSDSDIMYSLSCHCQ